MMLSDVCLSRTSGLSRLEHHFQGQKVKGQLVADVLNSQHAGTGKK